MVTNFSTSLLEMLRVSRVLCGEVMLLLGCSGPLPLRVP